MHKERTMEILIKTAILTFTFLMLIMVCISPSPIVGESDDYMLSTIALERHGSLRITQEDLNQAKIDFPIHADSLQESWDEGFPSLLMIDNNPNQAYPWYYGTYSAACIPMKKLLGWMQLDMSYAFAITNILFYACCLWFLARKLRASVSIRLLATLLLIGNPLLPYFIWPSAETFIASLMILAVTHLYNGKHHLAALFVALAGTLNPAPMVLGLGIILDFLWRMYEQAEIGRWTVARVFDIFKRNIKSVLLLAVCFFPALYSYGFNFVTFGYPFPQSMLGFDTAAGWFGRFMAYLFDWNMGFVVYMTLPFLLSFVLLTYAIWKKDRINVVFAFSFFVTVFVYARTVHINSGMVGIPRYSAWATPILAIWVATQFPLLYHAVAWKLTGSALLAMASALSLYIGIQSFHWNYLYHTPIAQFVLNHAPALYNAYPYTFISRTMHIDGGGYHAEQGPLIEQPTIYSTKGSARKILIPRDTGRQLLDMVSGSVEDMSWLEEQIARVEDRYKDFSYINVPANRRLSFYADMLYPAEREESMADLEKFSTGIYDNEGTFHWAMPWSEIYLKNEEITKVGLELDAGEWLPLIPYQEETTPKMTVFINGVMVAEVEVVPGAPVHLTVPPEALPSTENDTYVIVLDINGEYNPYLVSGSEDRRSLGILLWYVGPTREAS